MYLYTFEQIIDKIEIGMKITLNNSKVLEVIDLPEINEDNQNIRIKVLVNNEKKIYSLNHLYQKEFVKEDSLNVFKKLNRKIYKNHCWNCKSNIDSRVNELCPVCNQHYICSNCGYCYCLYNEKKNIISIK